MGKRSKSTLGGTACLVTLVLSKAYWGHFRDMSSVGYAPPPLIGWTWVMAGQGWRQGRSELELG